MNQLKWISAVIISAVLLTGCAHKKPILPVHDEVLVYALPYDLMYLRTLDALQTVPDWDLDTTDKENGLIRVRNVNYKHLTESEKRIVSFLIKRTDDGQSSVEITKDSQQVIGGGDLMKAVARELSQEVYA